MKFKMSISNKHCVSVLIWAVSRILKSVQTASFHSNNMLHTIRQQQVVWKGRKVVSSRRSLQFIRHDRSIAYTGWDISHRVPNQALSKNKALNGAGPNTVSEVQSDKFVSLGSYDHNMMDVRRIPFEQRVTQSRIARRMNHPFKYLYRHGFTKCNNSTASDIVMSSIVDPVTFLMREGGYSYEQICAMNQTFPMLLQLSVPQQLYPKLQFLKHTLHQSNPSSCFSTLPSFYYGTRLERIIAPRHAFLVWSKLPSGSKLFEPLVQSRSDRLLVQPTSLYVYCRFQDFLLTCRNPKHFAMMCQKWYDSDKNHGTVINNTITTNSSLMIGRNKVFTAKDVEAFDVIFGRGLLATVRNDLVQPNNSWPLDQLPTVRAADMVPLLIEHGANVYERDHRGATLIHWACGTGHWDIVQQLLPYFTDIRNTTTIRDGATPLHWAAAGCNTREFGIGGHVHVCQELLLHVRSHFDHKNSEMDLVNCCTYDGNSPLMWAAWSGTLETVKLLVRHNADTTIVNRNGCSVAHWAASGGNLAVCQYLRNISNVDFSVTNFGGNTPLSHAVAFGRTEVVQWLLQNVESESNAVKDDKILAYSLAQDFVDWTQGESNQRNEILQLFDDNEWTSTSAGAMSSFL